MSRAPIKLVQLSLLTLAMWASMYARTALGPLQETMHHVMGLSDNEMSVLQGLAIGVPMALGSLPIGFLADHRSRARLLLVAVALAVSSFVLTAFATQFWSLLAARCVAGGAAAAILIAAFSLVGDLYAPDQRGRASTLLAAGELLGSPASFALGGMLLVTVAAQPAMEVTSLHVDHWRWALLWMGGLLLPVAALMVCLREPVRTGAVQPRPSVGAALPLLWTYRAIAFPILVARGMVWLADGSVFVWGAPSFARHFGMPPDKVGALMGAVLLFSGLVGPAVGGALADHCQKRGGPRSTMHALALIALMSAPAALFAFMPSVNSAALALGGFLTLGFVISTAGVTLSIVVIPVELRGVYLGTTFTLGSFFFYGIAPLTVSALSLTMGGESEIGHALSLMCGAASLIAAAVFLLSARFFPSAGSDTVEALQC